MLPSHQYVPFLGIYQNIATAHLVFSSLDSMMSGIMSILFPIPSLVPGMCSINMNESKCQMRLNSKTNYKANLMCSRLQTEVPSQINPITTSTKSPWKKLVPSSWIGPPFPNTSLSGTSGWWESWRQEMWVLAPTLLPWPTWLASLNPRSLPCWRKMHFQGCLEDQMW